LLTRNALLAVRDGRLFLIAQALDALAIGVSLVALPWLVLQNGGSHAEAGLVYSVSVLPYVVFGLTAGSIGDRLPRRQVMLAGHLAQAACAAVIPLWTLAGSPPVGVVLAAAFAVGSGRVFVDAAAFGAVASIVGAEKFTEGQAALSASWSLGFLAGPALGGALVAAIGPGRALAGEAAALAFAALLIGAVRASFARPGPADSTGVREGVMFMVRNRGIATYTVVTVIWNLAAAGAFALMVPLLRDGVELPSRSVGGVLAVGSLAFLAASALASWVSRRLGGPAAVVACFVASPFTIAALGVAGGLAAALVAVFAFELMEGLVSVLVIGERQRRAPERLQARVGIAGRMILLGSTAAGSAIASALTSSLGIGHLYLAMAAATAVLAALTAPLLLRLED
jgi:predicted MFS family arabinose efflux permease